MGRPRITQPPVPVEFIRESFDLRDGVLIWKERAVGHFPNRCEDRGRFNAMFAGRKAGFKGPGGRPLVRLVYNGKTRRLALLRTAWIVAVGELPDGPVQPRDGNEWNAAYENLIVIRHGAHRPNAAGGKASSLERRAKANAALIEALATRSNPTPSELSEAVGLSEGRVSAKLGKLARAGLCASPMCVPGRSWCLTERGCETAASAMPPLDDLDRDVLTVLARQRAGIVSIARKIGACPMTARRRINLLIGRGLVHPDLRKFYTPTPAGFAALGPTPAPHTPWVRMETSSAAGARDVRERGQDDRTSWQRSQHASAARLKASETQRANKLLPFNTFGSWALTG